MRPIWIELPSHIPMALSVVEEVSVVPAHRSLVSSRLVSPSSVRRDGSRPSFDPATHTSVLPLRNDMADCQRADYSEPARLLGRGPLMKAGHVVRVLSCKAKAGGGDLQTEIGAISLPTHSRPPVLLPPRLL